MIFLELDELLHIAQRTLGEEPAVRDYGLLGSVLARPSATVHGKDAYGDIHRKAAALLHSLARNHALVDGNKRVALAGILAFYGMNGIRLSLTNDDAYRLVISVASGELSDIAEIAGVLERATARLREEREAQIAEAYRRGYARDRDEDAVGEAGLRVGSTLLAGEELADGERGA